MKVVILGGSGVFGSRLARLLVRDGHDVVLAARRGCAELAAELGVQSLAFDRAQDPAPLFEAKPDVIVDAAGPFQAYGSDYSLARAAIAAGVNYLDLSDDADFTAGISVLDAEAKAAGVYVLSGVSSVPALSSAAVTALADGQILAIDGAILPGNRAPRGRAVMAAILAQVGRPMRVWRGGRWDRLRGWSDPKVYVLPGEIRRRGWLNRVPDLECFPDHFDAKSVTFRAGLELGVMGWGLAALSWVRRFISVPVPLGGAHWMAERFEPFGTDQGGMVVSVTQKTPEGVVTRSWRLLAQGGDGPYVPAIPARALVNAGGAAPGARAALSELPLAQIEAAMADLQIRFDRVEDAVQPLFAEVLGPSFAELPQAVQDSHAVHPVHRLEGRARVTRGTGVWPALVAWAFRFPPAAEDVAVEVTKVRRGAREVWERDFGGQRFRSVLTATPAGMTERFGPFTFTLGLHVTDEGLHFPVRKGRLGPIPLPRFALPVSEAREYTEDAGMRFDVTLYAPLTGAWIIRYEGALEPVA